MPRFSDSNIESDAIIGKGIDLEELFDRRIVIEKIKIDQPSFRERMRPVCVCKCKLSSMPNLWTRPIRTATFSKRMPTERQLERGVPCSPGATI